MVPYTGTRAWVYDLGLKQSRPWHSWSLQGSDQVRTLHTLWTDWGCWVGHGGQG